MAGPTAASRTYTIAAMQAWFRGPLPRCHRSTSDSEVGQREEREAQRGVHSNGGFICLPRAMAPKSCTKSKLTSET